MKKASAKILVPQTPTEVFQTVTAVDRMAHWIKGLTNPCLDGDLAQGKEMCFSAMYAGGGTSFQYRFKVHSWIPNRVFGFHSTEGPLPFRNWLVLNPINGGTQVTSNIVPRPNGPTAEFIFRNFGPLIRFVIHRQQVTQLKSLKRYLASK